MEEVATCICGNQTWYIYKDRVECTKCKKEIEFSEPTMFKEVMDQINVRRAK